MKLLTKELEAKLLANGKETKIADPRFAPDHIPVVKFFTPDAGATWLFTELDEDGDTLFGLCDLGLGFPELGFASLSEIKALRGPVNLPVERDIHATFDKPLSKYAEIAFSNGRIALS